MKTKVITRTGYKCLQNYEDNKVNIRLYVADKCIGTYEVEIIDLEEDVYTYFVYPDNAWGPALEKYNFLVNRHTFRKSFENFGEAESIHTPSEK